MNKKTLLKQQINVIINNKQISYHRQSHKIPKMDQILIQ